MKNPLQTLKRAPIFLWKLLVGAAVCQFAWTSVLAIGWTFRLAQRTAVKRWWTLSSSPEKASTFAAQAGESAQLEPYCNFPNWFVAPNALQTMRADLTEASTIRAKFRAVRHGLFGSLWQNAKLGVQGILNVWVLTIIPIILWELGWYSGWDNSFNKGYEQYYVGIATSLIGIAVFLLAMLYLPLAQARQAVTGEWRSFYQFKTIWDLIRRRRLACLVLAGMFSALSLPLVAMRSAVPIGWGNSAAAAALSDAELLRQLKNYYFFVAMFGFAAYAFLRALAARIYAGALLEAFRAGELSVADFGGVEGPVLLELGLVSQDEPKRRHIAVEIVGKAVRPPWRVTVTAATLFLWFTFVAQIYVAEFLVRHVDRGFANQALVQLPWFRHIPEHLVEAANAEGEIAPEERGLSIALGR